MTSIIVFCICAFALRAGIRAFQQSEIRKNNPDAWLRLQELEHDQRRMRSEGIKNVAGFGITVAKLFMGK
jgi:hypothetical protein